MLIYYIMSSEFYTSQSTDKIGDNGDTLEYDDHDDETYMFSGQGMYSLNLINNNNSESNLYF